MKTRDLMWNKRKMRKRKERRGEMDFSAAIRELKRRGRKLRGNRG